MDPDIFCMQETKAGEEDVRSSLEALEGYHIYVNASKARKGYSGTTIASKIELYFLSSGWTASRLTSIDTSSPTSAIPVSSAALKSIP